MHVKSRQGRHPSRSAAIDLRGKNSWKMGAVFSNYDELAIDIKPNLETFCWGDPSYGGACPAGERCRHVLIPSIYSPGLGLSHDALPWCAGHTHKHSSRMLRPGAAEAVRPPLPLLVSRLSTPQWISRHQVRHVHQWRQTRGCGASVIYVILFFAASVWALCQIKGPHAPDHRDRPWAIGFRWRWVAPAHSPI